MQWFTYPVSNPHQTDDGVDIATPDNTPVSFPDTVKITAAGWHTYGGEVVGDVPGSGYSEYFIHLNDIYVQPGQTVPAGQVIGTTGGGVGDKVLHGGVVQPAQSQTWYGGASTGYHTEFGDFAGESIGAFDAGWGNPGRQLDPTPQINALRATGGQFGSILLANDPQGNALGNTLSGRSSTSNSGASGLDLFGIGQAITNAANSVQTGATTAIKRGGVFVIGGLLVIFGIFLIVRPGFEEKREQAAQAITGAAPQVAVNKLAPRPQASGQTNVTNYYPARHVHVHPAPARVIPAVPSNPKIVGAGARAGRAHHPRAGVGGAVGGAPGAHTMNAGKYVGNMPPKPRGARPALPLQGSNSPTLPSRGTP